MAKPLKKALQCLRDRKAEDLLRTYNGCYNYRNIKGTSRLSNHAFGMAIDINAGLTQPREVVECFEAAGFTWGGRWKNRDDMHFEIKGKK